MHGALAEGALSGFELQFETEWINRGPADGQLTFRCAPDEPSRYSHAWQDGLEACRGIV